MTRNASGEVDQALFHHETKAHPKSKKIQRKKKSFSTGPLEWPAFLYTVEYLASRPNWLEYNDYGTAPSSAGLSVAATACRSDTSYA